MTRFVLKPFASTGGVTGQFGSFEANGGQVGDGVLTDDNDTIQGLPAWIDGWDAATNNALKLPRLEEMNGVDKVFSEFAIQNHSDGITYWQAGMSVTAYQTIVQYQTGNNKPIIYYNITGTNTATAPDSDTTNWGVLYNPNSLSDRKLGEVVQSILPIIDSNYQLLDGSWITKASNATFYDYVESLTSNYNYLFATSSAYENSLSTYGVCGKFVLDADNEQVRVPTITGFIEGAATLSTTGDITAAGLPTHTHTRGTMNITGRIGNVDVDSASSTGAFYRSGTSGLLENGSGAPDPNVYFDASRNWTGATSTATYSSTLATSNTVQPQSIKVLYYMIV